MRKLSAAEAELLAQVTPKKCLACGNETIRISDTRHWLLRELPKKGRQKPAAMSVILSHCESCGFCYLFHGNTLGICSPSTAARQRDWQGPTQETDREDQGQLPK